MPPSPQLPTATTDYATAYNSLGYKYDPEVQSVNNQLNAIPGQQQQALSSLDQAKVNAFKTIGNNANARGLLFSGYQPDQQESYTKNTYQPGVQKVNDTAAANTKSLQDKITEINRARSVDAATLVQNTKDQQAAAAAAAQKAAVAAQTKATKAAQPTTNDIANSIRVNLVKNSGKDGYVSPGDYAKAYVDWINNGQSANSFDATFGKLKNPKNGYYNYAITQAIKRGS